MKRGMDLKRVQDLEFNSRWVVYLLNLKGSNIARSQLTGLDLQWEVTGGEPNLLSR